MRTRIFRSLFLLALTAVLLTSTLISSVLYTRTYEMMRQGIRQEAALIAVGIEAVGEPYLFSIPPLSQGSVARMARDGTILFSSSLTPTETLLQCPEIAAVLSGADSGEDARHSGTFGQQTFYYALALPDGTILRLSVVADNALESLRAAMPWLVLAVVLVLLLTLLLARRMADAILVPLNAFDPDQPEDGLPYDELTPLLMRLSDQKRTMRRQLRELSARQEEFRTLSENMGEGLLLLGPNAEIFSVNRAACCILGGDPERDWHAQHLLLLSRDYTLQALTKKALAGERGEGSLMAGSREYELIASPVAVEGQPRGALLLLLDVTDRRQAEQLRREFSANVSHELKTPLTSISGYAELLASGLVHMEDIKGFAARIHAEAARLIALVEDIMALSRLDENSAPSAREPVDLAQLTRHAAERLELQATSGDVEIHASQGSVMVSGVPGQLFELVYNLAENAVKYNRAGGSVTLCVDCTPDGVTLTVSDTGIGIPADAQGRVFERFYRVDKSRSKETGGTGLGLSIVKHIALLHGAHLDLSSQEGHGTRICVRFPPST